MWRRLGVAVASCFFSTAAAAMDWAPQAGQVAPDFTIEQMDGTTFQLSDYRGKQSVYLVFWNTWCGYCLKKVPKLKQIQADLPEQIRIIAINTGLDDSVEETLALQRELAINYPLAFEHDRRVTTQYGVWGTPTEFIIDINGVIQHRDKVPTEIESLLPQWNTLAHQSCDKTTALC